MVLGRVIFGVLVLSAAISAIVVHPKVAMALLVAPAADRLGIRPQFLGRLALRHPLRGRRFGKAGPS